MTYLKYGVFKFTQNGRDQNTLCNLLGIQDTHYQTDALSYSDVKQ